MPAKKKPARKVTKVKKKSAAKKPARKVTAPVLRTLTPTCAVKGARDAIALYERLFGAKLLMSLEGPDGAIAHAELGIGDSVFMIGEPWTEPVMMAVALRVDDAQAVWDRAITAGCTPIFPLEMQFYGDLAGRVRDPFGNQWAISTPVEKVAPKEQGRRFHKMMRGEPWQ